LQSLIIFIIIIIDIKTNQAEAAIVEKLEEYLYSSARDFHFIKLQIGSG